MRVPKRRLFDLTWRRSRSAPPAISLPSKFQKILGVASTLNSDMWSIQYRSVQKCTRNIQGYRNIVYKGEKFWNGFPFATWLQSAAWLVEAKDSSQSTISAANSGFHRDCRTEVQSLKHMQVMQAATIEFHELSFLSGSTQTHDFYSLCLAPFRQMIPALPSTLSLSLSPSLSPLERL